MSGSVGGGGMARSYGQHASHSGLVPLIEPAASSVTSIDAVIVPSARSRDSIVEAARLASRLKTPLVVLCSRDSRRDEVIEFVKPRARDVNVVAVDVREREVDLGVTFHTTEILRRTPFRRTSDTSVKRNLGLLLARSQGWRRVLFLDDDILVPSAHDVGRAACMLDDFEVVGLRLGGFPDNSVVCHANRQMGRRQDTFVGAGALLVNIDAVTSFFPSIYNEDWLFLLDQRGLRRLMATRRVTANQQPYDPFADPERASQEEFGDVLAEGIFALLDVHRPIADATESYWRLFIQDRRNLILDLQRHALRRPESDRRRHMLASLEAAVNSLNKITPEFCVVYLRAWHDDLNRWQERLRATSTPVDLDVALKELGLTGRWDHSACDRPSSGRRNPRDAIVAAV
jgi:hypothetical protein